MKILILSLVILLVLVLYWYFKKRKVVTTTTTTLPTSSTTTTINNVPLIVRSILIARPFIDSIGTISLCGKSPTDSDFVDLGTILTLYFKGNSSVPDNGVQLYTDNLCTVSYSRNESSLLAMKTEDGEGVFNYYDLYITNLGTVSGYFKCNTEIPTTTYENQIGWCYTVGIPSFELSLNGEFLEVQYVPYGQETPIWVPYQSILTLFDDDPNFTTFLLCGNSSGVQFRYGQGPAFVNYGWIINTCANCCDEETPCKP